MKEVMLIVVDGSGWSVQEVFESEQKLRDDLKENFDLEYCKEIRYDPQPLMIDSEFNVTQFDGYKYN